MESFVSKSAAHTLRSQEKCDKVKVWVTNEEFGKVWVTNEEFGKVWVTNEEFGKVWVTNEEFGKVWVTNEEFEGQVISDVVLHGNERVKQE
ncbi:pyridoxal-dependent decarboxylase domain-containing protein 2 X3 [Biomphalaria glabrata]|nr:putative pyridoxal-dependent decarboxylase domain-containing protein 2; transcript variant X3 [Biomphalaria glabrata]